MKIGFGATFLEKGLAREHMDGIGVYAKNLWEQFGSIEKQAITFGHQKIHFRPINSLGRSSICR